MYSIYSGGYSGSSVQWQIQEASIYRGLINQIDCWKKNTEKQSDINTGVENIVSNFRKFKQSLVTAVAGYLSIHKYNFFRIQGCRRARKLLAKIADSQNPQQLIAALKEIIHLGNEDEFSLKILIMKNINKDFFESKIITTYKGSGKSWTGILEDIMAKMESKLNIELKEIQNFQSQCLL